MLIGSINKQIEDIFIKLLSNERICKLLYYTKKTREDIDTLPKVKNPVGTLKHKVAKNRRLDTLQKDADVGLFINCWYKGEWKEYGKRHDKTLMHIIEVGVITHSDIDDTVNGSRAYALADLIIQELSDFNIEGLGKIHFKMMEQVRDMPNELTGYSLKFSIFSLKDEP